MLPLEHGKYYHIYNRGNNREYLFCTYENYNNFLRLYEKYIYPIADTYAWVLMKNHFHLLVRIREEEEIGVYLPLNSDGSNDSVRFKTTGNNLTVFAGNNLTESEGPVRVISPEPIRVIKPNPVKHFSHLFNAYAKYYNKIYNRTGALFERPFKRIEVTSDNYFRQLVVYIHTNPVHHKFCSDYTDYPWSSYNAIISTKPTKLNSEQILEWFDDRENFIAAHKQKTDNELLNDVTLE
jgi:putative transposase